MPNTNTQPKASGSIISQVAERIRTSDNVLVALSKDPSVDELSAALGLTFILDKIGKHATAIFSGSVPNAIEFLEPEKTFETNTNSLQDFIIALDKEKADHLRYKIDGDYVKVFITPYKTTIDEKDMEFSHGDYNVDLVIALNVASSDDLDSALTEYGRIMHDASSINISANVPGKFGDIEWGDPAASSVSEMIFNLSQEIKEKDKDIIDKSTATALLAGIVAATNRFSNERTSPDTMTTASKLMMAGADQQLISSSIPVDILTTDVVDASEDAKEEADSSDQTSEEATKEEPAEPADPTNLSIKHEELVDKPAEIEQPASKVEAIPKNEAAPKVKAELGTKAESKEEVEKEQESIEGPAPVAEEVAEEPVGADSEPEPEDSKSVGIEPAPIDSQIPDLEPVTSPAKPSPAPIPEPVEMPIPAPAPQPEPEPEPAEQSVEPPITPIAPAEPEPQITLAADAPIVSPEEQAKATAELEQLVSEPKMSGAVDESVMTELQSAHTKKNITPPGEALEPPETPKDYASLMETELSKESLPPAPISAALDEGEPLVAPVPNGVLSSDEPTKQDEPANDEGSAIKEPPVSEETVNNEYVDPLPMPNADSILPPPPAPFDLNAAPLDAADAPMPSAQEYANQIQNELGSSTADESVNLAAPITSMPAVDEQAAGNPSGAAQNNVATRSIGVMPDQVYPADPSAFRIPGM